MYEVITDLVDELVAEFPADAREQFGRFVEAVAESPLGGLLVDPEAPGEYPTLRGVQACGVDLSPRMIEHAHWLDLTAA